MSPAAPYLRKLFAAARTAPFETPIISQLLDKLISICFPPAELPPPFVFLPTAAIDGVMQRGKNITSKKARRLENHHGNHGLKRQSRFAVGFSI